jgi:hypothetical protein
VSHEHPLDAAPPTRVVLSLAVGVRAEELEVLDPIVVTVAVDGMERERQGCALPARESAELT